MKIKTKSVSKRFWEKVKWTSSCWEWTGALNGKGYGAFRFEGKSRGAHRFMHELIGKPCPDGLEIDHLCRNPLCVNPSHHEFVTGQVNVLRGEGPAARNARKNACLNGHAYDAVDSRGKRRCRSCKLKRQREYGRGYYTKGKLSLTLDFGYCDG